MELDMIVCRDLDKICRWKYDSKDDCWETSCENAFQFFAGNPQDNGFLFCPYCGDCIEKFIET